MQNEFPDQYNYLFDFGFNRLKRAHTVKLHAIKYCKNNLGIIGGIDKDSALKAKKTGLN